MNLLMRIAAKAVRAVEDALDPVCQNPDAVIYGRANGMTVRMRPIRGSDGRIADWIPDPDKLFLVAEEEAREAAEAAASAPPPPPLPVTPPQTQTPGNGQQGGFPPPPPLPGDSGGGVDLDNIPGL